MEEHPSLEEFSRSFDNLLITSRMETIPNGALGNNIRGLLFWIRNILLQRAEILRIRKKKVWRGILTNSADIEAFFLDISVLQETRSSFPLLLIP